MEPLHILSPRLRPSLSQRYLRRACLCLGAVSVALMWGLVCLISYFAYATPMLDQLSIASERTANAIAFEQDDSPLKGAPCLKATYASLSEPEQRAYEQIYQGLWLHRDSVTVSGVSTERVWDLFVHLRYDSPELFHVGEEYATETRTVYTAITKPFVTAIFSYTEDAQSLEACRKNLCTSMASVLAEAALLENDASKATLLHDRLCAMVAYGETEGTGHNAYDALCRGRAVCEGYALAFGLLCDQAGLANRIIVGRMDYVDDPLLAHAWNAVTCEGEERYVDATFDDDITTSDTYLLKDETFMVSEGYRPFKDNIPVVEA